MSTQKELELQNTIDDIQEEWDYYNLHEKAKEILLGIINEYKNSN